MPTLDTPPEHDAPPPPSAGLPPTRGGGNGPGRYNYLDTHELITLLDEIDDERAKARFREAVYLAIILWLVLALAYIFLPRWLPHAPVLIVQQRNPNSLTYLETPPNLKDLVKPKPSPRISERSTQAQSPRPVPNQPPPEPKAGRPQSPAPKPTPQAAQPPAQQAQPRVPQQQPQPTPPQTSHLNMPPSPRPNIPPVVDGPAPSPQRQPDFSTSRSASSAIQDAMRNSRAAGGNTQEQGDYGNAPRTNKGSGAAGYQILSDTQGVDFSRYIARLLADLRRNWLPLIPEECNSPLFKQGITGVRFTIQPNGQITGMNLDYSTHDDAINKAAWGSIKLLGSAAPLPKEFHGPNLELRIEFRVNKDREMQ